jgi:hypothetical protein
LFFVLQTSYKQKFLSSNEITVPSQITSFDSSFDLQSIPEISGSAKFTQLLLDASQRADSPPRGAPSTLHSPTTSSPHKTNSNNNAAVKPSNLNPKRLFPSAHVVAGSPSKTQDVSQ